MTTKAMQHSELIKIDRVLEKHGLKKTALRRNILSAFSETRTSLSQADLIEILLKRFEAVDRVSIYRNLSHLKAAGVLHEVDTNHYVFCSHECEMHAHVLLYCQKCHKHQEVKDHDRIASFMPSLDRFKFFTKKQPIFLRGVCHSCG
jgi:Fur family zinc uptake transcriptional regulator